MEVGGGFNKGKVCVSNFRVSSSLHPHSHTHSGSGDQWWTSHTWCPLEAVFWAAPYPHYGGYPWDTVSFPLSPSSVVVVVLLIRRLLFSFWVIKYLYVHWWTILAVSVIYILVDFMALRTTTGDDVQGVLLLLLLLVVNIQIIKVMSQQTITRRRRTLLHLSSAFLRVDVTFLAILIW